MEIVETRTSAAFLALRDEWNELLMRWDRATIFQRLKGGNVMLSALTSCSLRSTSSARRVTPNTGDHEAAGYHIRRRTNR
jgi:hypothetical protein